MDEQTYQVVYDITKTFPPIWFVIPLLFGAGIGVFLWRNAKNKNQNTQRVFMSLWLAGFICLGSLGTGNVLFEYTRCVNWLYSGNYQVVEGKISNFDPMPYGGHRNERFTVQRVAFEYSDYDLSKCGFNNTTSHGGPIQEGLDVRIAYHDGRILKIEVLGEAPAPQKIVPPEPEFPDDSFPFGFLSRYFWALALVMNFINTQALKKRSAPQIAQHPERASGYERLFWGYFVSTSIPWIMMGIGILFGGVNGVFSYFYLRSGNPFILAFHGSIILLSVALAGWVFFKNGAEFIVEHPDLLNMRLDSPSQVKSYTLLSLLGEGLMLVLLWYFGGGW